MTAPRMMALRAFLASDFIYRFRRDKVALVSFLVLLAFVLAGLLAPVLAPFDPYDPASIDIMNSEIPPVWTDGATDPQFLLGTDAQGRDMLSTILYGTRISLTIGIFAVMLQMVLGISMAVTFVPLVYQ